MKRIWLVTLLVCGLVVVTPPTASAGAGLHRVVALTQVRFGGATAPCPVAIATARMTDLSGRHVGDLRGCVQSVIGNCATLRAGCLQTTKMVIAYRFARGVVTARAVVEELGLSNHELLQYDTHGKIIRATGAFEGRRGRVAGGGTATFNGDGSITSTIVHVLTLI